MHEDRCIFDLIIVGCGISGLSAAITAAEAGQNVALLSKEELLEECNTFYAQGGIVYKGVEDSPDLLYQDIVKAGDYVNSQKATELLSNGGPQTVEDFLINKVKVPFIRNEHNEIDRTLEAAHTIRRIIHVKDITGAAIEKQLLAYAQKTPNLHFFSSAVAIDLITNTHNSILTEQRYQSTEVVGIYAYHIRENQVKAFFAPYVILATGGVGNLFLHTSNPPGATGDGIAMAYRIGAEIINAEYIQFHPTILFHRDKERFLLSEALRGEGAKLINKKGQYFMSKYAPELGDLAPRDEVARAVFKEMEAEGTAYVRLDTTLIKGINLEQRFPSIFTTCLDVGIDIRKQPIPVVPAADFFCGGIKVNLWGETSVPGLLAIGETACTGVHGANRLASVSLLEGLFWGVRAASLVAKKHKSVNKTLLDSIPDWILPRIPEDFEAVLINNDMLHIQTLMWNYAGIIRNGKRLSRALADLNYLSHRIEQFYKEAKLSRKIIELRNSVLTASIIVRAASSNRIAKGCHYIESLT
jgi:L-aspartate oxidase